MDQSVLGPEDTYTRLRQQIVADRGPWQQTTRGASFFIGDPRPEDVSLFDIAYALSRQCRYNGHLKSTVEHYSVAQHAWLVSKWMEEDGCSKEASYAGLHHDSAEAYTGDIVSQVKWLVPEFKPIERRVEAAVREALSVKDYPALRTLIKQYDLTALATERRDLLARNRSDCTWGDMPRPRRGETIEPWDSKFAREMFLQRHGELV